MSDYLDHLITRNSNLGGVFQPRPVALFESSPVAAWPDAGSHFDLEPIVDRQISEISTEYNIAQRQPEINPSTDQAGSDPTPPISHVEPGLSRPPKTIQRLTEQRPPRQAPSVQPPIEKSAIGQPSGRSELDPAQPTPTPLPTSGPVVRPKITQPPVAQEPPRENPGAKPASDAALTTFPPIAEPPVQSKLARRLSVENGPRQRAMVWPKQPSPAAGNRPSSPSDGLDGGRPEHEPAIQPTVIEQVISPVMPLTTNTAPTQTAGAESRTVLEPVYQHPELLPLQAIRGAVLARPRVRPAPAREPAVAVSIKPTPQPEPPRTIQVTIGRVEVRATPATPAPKKQRSKSLVMSLDEYLHQRAGGGRR